MEQNQTSPKGQQIQFKKSSGMGALIGVLMVLVAVALFVFLAKPISNDVSAMKVELVDKAGQVEELSSRIDKLNAAEEALDLSTEVQKRQAQRSIPKEMLQNEVIEDVIAIAESSDVNLNSLSFGRGGSEKEGVNSLRVNASFAGNYNDLTGFLRKIETNGRFLRVNSISVQINTVPVSGLRLVNFTLSMEAFFQNQDN